MRSTRLLAIGCTLAAITALLAGCTAAPASPENAMPRIVPQPATVRAQDGGRFELTSSSRIVASGTAAGRSRSSSASACARRPGTHSP